MHSAHGIILAATLMLATAGCAASDGTHARPAPDAQGAAAEPPIAAADPLESIRAEVRADAARFIRDYQTIALTPAQEQIKTDALSAIPAPCCDDFSIATCCCPCNLAKAVWGLAHRMIVEEGAGEAEVRVAAETWLADANPDGFSGRACYTAGGCTRAFHRDGCGGMSEETIAD